MFCSQRWGELWLGAQLWTWETAEACEKSGEAVPGSWLSESEIPHLGLGGPGVREGEYCVQIGCLFLFY